MSLTFLSLQEVLEGDGHSVKTLSLLLGESLEDQQVFMTEMHSLGLNGGQRAKLKVAVKTHQTGN